MSNNKIVVLLRCIAFVFTFGSDATNNNRTPSGGPLLVVAIMVKNEESVIVESIEPYVKGGIDAFLIYDTGSTDRTIERITNYFKDVGITNFVVAQEPFVYFDASRNRGLSLAEHYFPDAAFFLMPDAEWYMKGVEHLLEFCKDALNDQSFDLFSIDAYYKHNCNHYGVPRLFRNGSYVRFRYRIHEIPISAKPTIRVPANVWIHHNSSEFGDEKTRNRIARDIEWLLLEHKEDPFDTRPLYYLGQEYTVLGEYHTAIEYFKKRNALADEIGEKLEEEHFVSLLRIGQMYEQLYFNGEATWQDAEYAYLQAALYRPSRSEPLMHLANHYMRNNDPMRAYAYLIHACRLAYPYQDILSINKELYDFDRWDILARVAAPLGKLQEAYEAAYRALKVHPDTPGLHAIISYCAKELEKHRPKKTDASFADNFF